VRINVSAALARAEVDGVTTSAVPTSDVGNFEWIYVGLASQSDSVEAFYDDVVVSTVPVPCLPM
jgi:hypothetical protein